jgi:cell division protein FtsB
LNGTKKKIKTLEDPKGLEAFARETYYIKKPNEEIYIIEDDSIRDTK